MNVLNLKICIVDGCKVTKKLPNRKIATPPPAAKKMVGNSLLVIFFVPLPVQ